MKISDRIKSRRIELGLSVDDVAEKLKINRATVYRYESNDIEKLPITVIEPLATVLKTTPEYLMGWDDLPKTVTISKSEQKFLNAYTLLKESGDPKDRAAAAAIEQLLGVSEPESGDKQ